MTRVATAENEAKLLGFARSATGAQLERICRGCRQVTAGRKPRRDDERRYLRQRHTASGMVRIEAQLRPDEAALVMQALGEMRRAARDGGDGEEASETRAEGTDHQLVQATRSQREYVTAENTLDTEPNRAADGAAPRSAVTKSRRKYVTAESTSGVERDTPTPNLADGLVLMAESALARGPAARRAGERNQLIVRHKTASAAAAVGPARRSC